MPEREAPSSRCSREVPLARGEGGLAHVAAVDGVLSPRLVDEAPSAYQDIGRVMRAQRDLVRIVRRLRPLLSYKGA